MVNKKILTNQIDLEILQPIIDMLEDAIVVHDSNRVIKIANRSACNVTGYNKEEILEHDCHSVFPPDGLCGGGCDFKDSCHVDNCERVNGSTRETIIPFFKKNSNEIRLKISSVQFQQGLTIAIIKDLSVDNIVNPKENKTNEFHGIVGNSAGIRKIFDTIKAVSSSEYPVLINGESGTGKELVAKAIHLESRKNGGPFVPVNCGALPDNILESELFGHVRGAFTGAIRDKKGRFELAAGGTLFLDEIGELPLQMQVKLLRVLQEKTFERVGGEKSIRSSARIISATNKNLRKMVKEGTFREDLFYRLCVVPVTLPPLRDRRPDIKIIINKVLKEIARENNSEILTLSNSTMDKLYNYSWPGNIRELINALQYSSVHTTDGIIKQEDLPFEIEASNKTNSNLADISSKFQIDNAEDFNIKNDSLNSKTKLTSQAINDALTQTGGNKMRAAKLLGIGRATLYRHLPK